MECYSTDDKSQKSDFFIYIKSKLNVTKMNENRN